MRGSSTVCFSQAGWTSRTTTLGVVKVPAHTDGEGYLNAWAETFSIPTFLIGEGARILWVNAAAERILVQGEPFLRQNGLLVCADKSQGAGFQVFLASVQTEPGAWIMNQADQTRLLVRGESLRPAGEEHAVSVMLYPTNAEERYVWADFGRIFRLTKAELAVVKVLLNGASVDEIAEQQAVSVETVRTHVRRLYSKLGVNNREQLFATLSQFRFG